MLTFAAREAATGTNRGNHETRDVEALIRDAHSLGLGLSPSKLSKLARHYRRDSALHGTPFEAWLRNVAACPAQSMPRPGLPTDDDDNETGRTIRYADPTGDTAARRVDDKARFRVRRQAQGVPHAA